MAQLVTWNHIVICFWAALTCGPPNETIINISYG